MTSLKTGPYSSTGPISRLVLIQVPNLSQNWPLFKYLTSLKTGPYSSTCPLSRLVLIQVPDLFQNWPLFKYLSSLKTGPYSSTCPLSRLTSFKPLQYVDVVLTNTNLTQVQAIYLNWIHNLIICYKFLCEHIVSLVH